MTVIAVILSSWFRRVSFVVTDKICSCDHGVLHGGGLVFFVVCAIGGSVCIYGCTSSMTWAAIFLSKIATSVAVSVALTMRVVCWLFSATFLVVFVVLSSSYALLAVSSVLAMDVSLSLLVTLVTLTSTLTPAAVSLSS